MSDLESIAERAALRAIPLYAKQHLRPTHVTIGQAADMLQIGRWKATRLVRAGILKLNSCGLIPIEEVDRARGVGSDN